MCRHGTPRVRSKREGRCADCRRRPLWGFMSGKDADPCMLCTPEMDGGGLLITWLPWGRQEEEHRNSQCEQLLPQLLCKVTLH